MSSAKHTTHLYTLKRTIMRFNEVLPHVKEGNYAARTGWNGKNQFIFFMKGESLHRAVYFTLGSNKIVTDQIWISAASGKVGPYALSQCDCMAEDWVIVDAISTM